MPVMVCRFPLGGGGVVLKGRQGRTAGESISLEAPSLCDSEPTAAQSPGVEFFAWLSPVQKGKI